MQYMLLIYGEENESSEPPQDEAEREKWIAPWAEYSAALKDAGVLVAGEALQPSSTATTVSVSGESREPVFTDGPFVETKEQLGGYYLIDCKDLDEALAWAAKCPGVRFGKVEVRPIALY